MVRWSVVVHQRMQPQENTIFPLEFFIAGTPRALGASPRSKDRWRQLIKTAAQARIADSDELAFIDDRSVAVTIFYFCAEPMEGDIDNIAKLLLDGMKQAAYPDDRCVERVVVQKFEPGIDRAFGSVTDKLAEALNTAPPCVYIRVDDDLSWRNIE